MISKSNGKWLADITPGGRGNKRYRKLFNTQAEAKRFEVYLLNEYRLSKDWNHFHQYDGRQLLDFCDIWYQLHGKNLKDGVNRLLTLRMTSKGLGNPTLEQLNSKIFTVYRSKRLDSVTANTVNHELAYLKAMLNELIRCGEIDKNPLQLVRKLKVDETELSFLSLQQIDELLSELKQSKNGSVYTIAKICLSCGVRWREAEALTAEQVRNEMLYLSKTKSGKNRSLPINKQLEQEILNKLPFQKSYYAFKRAIQRAGIKTPKGQLTHILRHTFASQFMANGGNILVLQRALGHSHITMTMRYAHFSPDHLQEIKKLNPLANIGELL